MAEPLPRDSGTHPCQEDQPPTFPAQLSNVLVSTITGVHPLSRPETPSCPVGSTGIKDKHVPIPQQTMNIQRPELHHNHHDHRPPRTHLAPGNNSVSTVSFRCLLDAQSASTSPPDASHASPTNRRNAPAASMRLRRISNDLGAPNARILHEERVM